MSDNDLDLPLLPSAEQIRRKEFATVRRGYDTEQVREYLRLVADQIEELERELNELRGGEGGPEGAGPPGDASPPATEAGEPGTLPALRPSAPTPTPEGADRFSSRIAQVLKAAETEASAAVEDAKAEAAALLEDARAEADRIRVDAQARAEEDRQRGRETLADARQEAAELLVELQRRRDEMTARLREMREMLLEAAEELRDDETEAEEAPARPDAAPDVEIESRIQQIFGPRNRVDVPDLEPTAGEGDEDA